ncbi:hypothetical protein [Sphingomonas xinjiangensis]|uniref:Uncharacterized protein n=1 Tax=Sphingomonas xinjiangensis TaxID=643568 RepID=A0A840YTI4_9SPHN|nr:hypothetical protein [Sphingomonas xinjiangensis]MBB5712978.1 hypothetical protein [Sphingomonas xinjiangensis]
MQEERERGRIIGLRKRRLETAAWAATFIPLLAEARLELPEYAGRGEPSRQAYSNWLNHPSREIPSRNKGSWKSETIGRLFDIHIGLIDEAEQEFDIAIAIIRFKWKHADAEARKALADEEARVRDDRAKDINDAYRLSAHLRGRTYVDQDIPPRLQIVSSVRKKRSKPKQEPVEVQLSLF